jgi:hypothetical protein
VFFPIASIVFKLTVNQLLELLCAQYDESSPVAALTAFGGTALKTVLKRPDFYLIMLVHIVLSILYYDVWHNPVVPAASTGQEQSWPFLAAATTGKDNVVKGALGMQRQDLRICCFCAIKQGPVKWAESLGLSL